MSLDFKQLLGNRGNNRSARLFIKAKFLRECQLLHSILIWILKEVIKYSAETWTKKKEQLEEFLIRIPCYNQRKEVWSSASQP